MCYHRQSYEESARVASEAVDVDPEHTFANRLRENLYERRHGVPPRLGTLPVAPRGGTSRKLHLGCSMSPR